MSGIIDIHTHILPGVDDGAQAMPEALQMIRDAYADGTRALILTPHYRGKFRENTPPWLREMLDVLRSTVADAGIDMGLYLGSEVHYQSDVIALVSEGKVLTMAGSDYLLLEFPFAASPSQVRAGLNAAISGGYTPILAHVERYDCFRKQPALAEEMHELGGLIQLNASGVMGGQGYFVKRYCAGLLKKGLVHFIASDAHDTRRRPPLLMACRRQVAKHYGEDYAEALFWENPQKVIENRMI